MSRPLEAAAAQPKISFSNWILGGSLVTVPTRRRTIGVQLPSGDADKGPKPKYKHYQYRRVSRDKATDTEKDAEKENKKKEEEAEAAKNEVPKDEIAKKEEVTHPFVLVTHHRYILIIACS